ncbi:MAG: hypothetical protein JWN56_2479 [Sphingobacteriales bacterium]|nr:hypothetical protein [Sphingobacteriales bacterium]
MKLLSVVLIFLLCVSCGDSKKTPMDKDTMEKEKTAIRKVIENETKSFFERDYNSWAQNYAHTDYAFQAWSNRDGTFDANVGWTDINDQLGKYISDNPEKTHPVVERKNMLFKFFDENLAYLIWDQFNSDLDKKNFHHSKEVRLMEKINGQWKIVCVSAFWDHKNPIPADRLRLIKKMHNESRGKNKI